VIQPTRLMNPGSISRYVVNSKNSTGAAVHRANRPARAIKRASTAPMSFPRDIIIRPYTSSPAAIMIR
jgi:hypothetical protein